MAQFALAIETILKHEGGYTNDPSDPGGETNWGISKRAYPDLDIRHLSREAAIDIYKRDFWNPAYDRIGVQQIATQVFDLAVNAGQGAANRLLQQAAASLTVGPLVIDGKLGPKTLEAINAIEPAKLLTELKARVAVYYALIVLAHPSQVKFLLGWMRREIEI